jgi:predicted HicB family RNase H-like nuclease
MTAFEAYEIYVAVKTHFTKKQYDFFRFKGKTKVTISSFESREDRSFFYKICNKYSKAKLIDLFVANFVDNPDLWIGDFLDETAEDIYSQWQKKIESLSYFFSEECHEMLSWMLSKEYKFNDIFRINNSDHPIIVKMALQKVISLETFIIFDSILNFSPYFNKHLDDIIWNTFWLKVSKYSPFINIDRGKCKSLLRNILETEYQHAT